MFLRYLRLFTNPPLSQNLFFIGTVALVLVCSIIFLSSQNAFRYPYSNTSQPTEQDASQIVTTAGPVLAASSPISLRIPSLNIDTPFSGSLGLNSAGEVEVPEGYEEVGWYKYGPTPGQLGPAVVLGHVDSYTGPAIFFYLGQLNPGDDVFIDREDGTTAHFEVTLLERYKQDDFPTSKIYGNIDHAGLRLITCSGTYIKGTQRYTHNLVVFARLVE